MLTMAQQLPQTAPETRPHTVLRAICMAGQRVEVGQVVHLTRHQAIDLATAGKVSAQPVAEPPQPVAAGPKATEAGTKAPPRKPAG